MKFLKSSLVVFSGMVVLCLGEVISWGPSQAMPPAPLRPYDGPQYQFPIKTQYPDTVNMEGGCGQEGCGFTFTFMPPKGSQGMGRMSLFLPRGVATAEAQEAILKGPQGLLKTNGWTVKSVRLSSDRHPYDWVKKIVTFTTPDKNQGQIILGETDGQAIEVLLLYSPNLEPAFTQAMDIVLKNLVFEPSLLPLQPAGEGAKTSVK